MEGNQQYSQRHIAIAADHHGYHLKTAVQDAFRSIAWHDVGAYSQERSDYPVFACKALALLLENRVDGAILLCGTGQGMAIASNRIPGIYAAIAWNPEVAARAKAEDHACILVLPADYLNAELSIAIVDSWLSAKFLQERYVTRLKMLEQNAASLIKDFF